MLNGFINVFLGQRQTISAQKLQEELEIIRAKRNIDNQPIMVFSAKHPEGVEKCPCCGRA